MGAAAFCALAVILPFLAVEIPPITDLPQQTAQVRLLLTALAAADSPYQVQFWHPNKLGYLPLLLAWTVVPPLAVGRVALAAIGLLWVAAIHFWAYREERSVGAATLATLLFMNHLTYWGLLNFLSGLPVFLLWLGWLAHPPVARKSHRGGVLTGIAGLLYSAHVLWLLAGWLWLGLSAWRERLPLSTTARRLAWTTPWAVAVLCWYPQLSRQGFDSEVFWGQSLLTRLHPSYLWNSAWGGLKGPVEPLLAGSVVLWLLLGGWQHRQAFWAAADRRLLTASALLLTAALTLPGVAQHTIFFASRWIPVAGVLLILGWPAPRWRPALNWTLPALLVAALSLATTTTWREFERAELTGLTAVLRQLPAQPKVLGLDFVRTSSRIQGYPFYHLYAYAQVAHGGELNRSFANEASSLVVYRDLPRQQPWTADLDWKPQQLRKSDIGHFEWVIVHADEALQAHFLADPQLQAMTDTGRWRLYRVIH